MVESRSRLLRSLPSILSVLTSLLVCLIALAVIRGDFGSALEAYRQMFVGGLGDVSRAMETGRWDLVTRPLGESAIKGALLILTGLSVAVAFQVGLFNIGAQGQLVVGAIAAAAFGAHVELPGLLHVPLALAAGALVGSGWAIIPAWLKVGRGVHEVISTIMLNWIAVSLVENWLVVGPLAATAEAGASRAGTAEIHASAQLPRMLGELSRLHLGFPLALLIAFGVWLWLTRTHQGFETRVVGLSPEAARNAGIPVAKRIVRGMALAGALSGLAGAMLVMGTEFNYPASLGGGYGFDGIAMALLGNAQPVGTAISALFFGILKAGGTRMQLVGVHRSFPELIQGLALLLVAARLVWVKVLAKRRRPDVVAAEVAPHA